MQAGNGTGCQGGAPVGCKNGKCGKSCTKPCKPGGGGAGPADMRLGGGILSYYGDDVLAFDTLEEKWSRIGKMPYGLVTSHWYAHKQPAIPFHLLLFLGDWL